MNEQPIQRQNLILQYLDLHSMFFTIQGEGMFSGQRAIFIRLSGCNLQCPWCDTEYTGGTAFSSLQIYSKVQRMVEEQRKMENLDSGNPLIVITGGEPFRQNITSLVKRLSKAGYRIQIETNGTLAIPDFPYELTTIVCSPKTGKVNKNLSPHIDAYKYVLDHTQVSPVDGLPITCVGHPAKNGTARPANHFQLNTPVYVTPLDTKDDAENQLNVEAVIKSAKKHGYIAQIQLHKYLGVE